MTTALRPTKTSRSTGAGAEMSIFYVVPDDQLVPDLHPTLDAFRDGEAVFATGYLIGLLEAPCMDFLRHHRAADGQTPVGAKVEITHRAPSIPGDRLHVTARCTHEIGTRFAFAVTAHDQHGVLVASGHVVQHLVNVTAFRAALHERAAGKGTPMNRLHEASTSRNSTNGEGADTGSAAYTADTTGELAHRLGQHGFIHRARDTHENTGATA
ncbi:thioesterase family protein [Pseudonocardia sp. ICBG601]|uniref:thioesterase family protein n=1 Tax=Pseudonocardia sp. ICBG601 TaxID=2846759 RepID=UPI001CF71329|nr:hotdog domain-containing protein [Pseudonocardia sp. ICBG601]